MADEIRATPRSPILGLFSDIVNLPLQYMSAPERTQQSQGVAQFLYGTGIPKTLERASYGESLFSGAGGLGGTTRMRPETAEAVLNVAPFAKPAAVMANQAAMTAGRAGARYAERVVPQVMSRGGLPAQLLGDVSRGSVRPLDVYHGTPHTLPPTERNPLGEFDASKIGTGEGNQAYGYGIYTAESPDVARTYQNTLSKYGELRFADGTVKNVQDLPYGSPEQIAGQIWINKPNLADAKFALSNLDSKYLGASKEDVLKQLESLDAGKAKLSGNFYKVDLPDEKIATMLDWDKPLSQQSPQVQAAIEKITGLKVDKTKLNEFDDALLNALQGGTTELPKQPLDPMGSDLYQRIIGGGNASVAQKLQEQGVAGIKYLDEGSRATGQGTRNFVVFPNEEKSMTILERNGMPASQIQPPTYSDPFGNTIGSSIR